MFELVSTKIYIAVGTFLISFTSAAAPLKVIHIDDHVFSIGNMFSAGILFAAGLVHQLPDSASSLEGALAFDFPLASFLAGFSFTLFLILEEYLHTQLEDRANPFHYDYDANIPNLKAAEQRPHEQSSLVAHDASRSDCLIEPENADCAVSASASASAATISIRSNSIVRSERSTGIGIAPRDPTMPRSSVLDSMRDYSFGYEHPVHYHEEHLADHAQGSLLSSVVLLVALSFHGLLEALAIGMATSRSSVVSTASAVLAHKAFAGYALGSAMVAAHMRKLHVLVLSFVFGLVSIFGVVLGTLLQTRIAVGDDGDIYGNGNGNGNGEGSVPVGIIQAVVSGTFLYVSIVEIAMKELLTHRAGSDLPVRTCQVRKLVAFLLGYLVMAVFALWV